MADNSYRDILVVCSGLVLIALIFNLHFLLWVVLAIAFLSLLSKFFLQNFLVFWKWLAQWLGRINAFILLTLLFVLLVLPIGILFRLTSRKTNYMHQKQQGSYYKLRDEHFVKEDFERPY